MLINLLILERFISSSNAGIFDFFLLDFAFSSFFLPLKVFFPYFMALSNNMVVFVFRIARRI